MVAIFMDLPGLISPSFQPSLERDARSGGFGDGVDDGDDGLVAST